MYMLLGGVSTMAGFWRPVNFIGNIIQCLFFQVLVLILVVQLYPANSAPEILRPRGVAISKAPLYDPEKDFKCFDGSRTLPFSMVNDDYCDCPDASDEPGTSACPSGSFHCTNAGHHPLNIPSSRVNDGLCDCCDGTDEYASSAGCENICLEQGRSARAAALRRAELAKQGNELRLQLTRQGKQLKSDKKVRLEQLQKDREEAEKIKHEKESLKSAAEELEKAALEKYRQAAEEERAKQSSSNQEEQEAFEHFQRLDSDQDGFIRIPDLQTRQTFDKDRNGEVSEEEAKYFMGEDELDWSTFYAQAWPRMKPYILMEKGLFTPPAPAPSIEAPGDNAEEFPADNSEEDDEEEEEPSENPDVPEAEAEAEADAAEPAEETQYDENTQQLIEEARKARTEYDDADKSVRDVDREIHDIEDALSKDFGLDEEFATLQGQCFEYTDREYTYKMCPFDQVTQTPKSGGADTRLGTWGRWSGTPNKYSTMLFEHGQGCWNGPQRTATINFVCGLENKLTTASEPNRCEYLFEFSTPAICISESESSPHDEL